MTPYQQAMEFFGERAQSVAGSVIVRTNQNVLVVDAATGEFTEEGRALMAGDEPTKRRGRPPKQPKFDLGADVFVDATIVDATVNADISE